MAEAAVLEGNVAAAPEPDSAPVEETLDAGTGIEGEEPVSAEAAPEQGEPEDPPSKWQGKSDDEIEAAIESARKDTEARTRQSEHDRAQSDALRSQRLAEQQYVQSGGILNDLRALVKWSLDEGKDVGPEHLQRMVNRAWGAISHQNTQALDELIADAMPKGSVLPAEKVAELDRLRDKVGVMGRDGKPLATLDDLVKARLNTLVDAAVEARKPELKAAWEKERAETAKNRTNLAAARKGDAERTGTMRPTAGSGSVANLGSNRQIMDTAHPSSAEYRRAYEAEYGFKP
jgi:hypothetical protein